MMWLYDYNSNENSCLLIVVLGLCDQVELKDVFVGKCGVDDYKTWSPTDPATGEATALY